MKIKFLLLLFTLAIIPSTIAQIDKNEENSKDPYQAYRELDKVRYEYNQLMDKQPPTTYINCDKTESIESGIKARNKMINYLNSPQLISICQKEYELMNAINGGTDIENAYCNGRIGQIQRLQDEIKDAENCLNNLKKQENNASNIGEENYSSQANTTNDRYSTNINNSQNSENYTTNQYNNQTNRISQIKKNAQIVEERNQAFADIGVAIINEIQNSNSSNYQRTRKDSLMIADDMIKSIMVTFRGGNLKKLRRKVDEFESKGYLNYIQTEEQFGNYLWVKTKLKFRESNFYRTSKIDIPFLEGFNYLKSLNRVSEKYAIRNIIYFAGGGYYEGAGTRVKSTNKNFKKGNLKEALNDQKILINLIKQAIVIYHYYSHFLDPIKNVNQNNAINSYQEKHFLKMDNDLTYKEDILAYRLLYKFEMLKRETSDKNSVFNYVYSASHIFSEVSQDENIRNLIINAYELISGVDGNNKQIVTLDIDGYKNYLKLNEKNISRKQKQDYYTLLFLNEAIEAYLNGDQDTIGELSKEVQFFYSENQFQKSFNFPIPIDMIVLLDSESELKYEMIDFLIELGIDKSNFIIN